MTIEGCKHGPTYAIPQPCQECERERREQQTAEAGFKKRIDALGQLAEDKGRMMTTDDLLDRLLVDLKQRGENWRIGVLGYTLNDATAELLAAARATITALSAENEALRKSMDYYRGRLQRLEHPEDCNCGGHQ